MLHRLKQTSVIQTMMCSYKVFPLFLHQLDNILIVFYTKFRRGEKHYCLSCGAGKNWGTRSTKYI